MDPATARLVERVRGSVAFGAQAPTPGAPGPRAGVSLLDADAGEIAAFRAAGGGHLALPDADGGVLELELEPDDTRLAPGALTVTDDSGRHPVNVDVTLFRGHVVGEPDSWAVVAMGGAGVFGTLERDGRRWTLAPAMGRSAGVAPRAHVLAPEALRPADAPPQVCGLDAANEREFSLPSAADVPPGARRAPEEARATAPLATQLAATRTSWKVAVDCDWEVYHDKFGDDLVAATSYVLTVLGTVNLIYERDLEATLVVNDLNLWTTAADPYSATSAASQLTQMQGWWATNRAGVVRSLAFLMSGRQLGGGFSVIASLCNTSSAYSVASMDFIYGYPTTTSTWDVNVVAHEIGHVFGSWHTQSCNWALQGYVPANTTIDSCFTSEGGCATYTNHLPPGKGTIMSYCHIFFGEANGIRLDFHPIVVQRIRAVMSVAACSTQMAPQPPRNAAASPIAGGARVTWTASTSPNVLGYEVFRSRFPLDVHPSRAGFVVAPPFDDASLGTYFYRVRTVRTADTSSWSNEVSATSPCAVSAGAPLAAGTQPVSVVSADLNGDGREDLLLGRGGDGSLGLMFGLGTGAVGDGTFTPVSALPDGVVPGTLALADLNGDGVLDIVAGDQGDRVLRIHLGLSTAGVANGSFGPAVGIATLPFPIARVRTADLDEDGIEDLLVATGPNVLRFPGQGTAGVGDGTFGPPVATSAPDTIVDMVVQDLDADGILDLVVTTALGVQVRRGAGLNGHGDGSFGPATTYPAGGSPGRIAVTDLDGDGAPDLVVCDRTGAAVEVLQGILQSGTPSGTFVPAVAYAAGTAPSALAIVDWDRNGTADVVVANDTAPGHVNVLLGYGDGRLASRWEVASGGDGVADLVARDFDENGALDVMAVHRTSGTVARLVGTCAGSLSNAVTLLSPNGGEAFFGQQDRVVSWTQGPGVLSVDLEWSRDGGSHWKTIARDISGTSWHWTVPNLAVATNRLRVVVHGMPQSSDASDADFSISPDVTLDAGGLAPSLALLGASPNPARRTLRVTFALPAARAGSLELVDLLGRRVARRDLGSLGAGTHSMELLDGRALPPGLYLLRLDSGGERRTAKVAIVR